MPEMPLYHRIYTVLREEIRDGSHAPGDLLPGETDLAARFGVSRVTIRKTLEQLASDGLVDRRQGRGTFVRETHGRAPVRAEVTGLVDNLLAMGLRTEVKVLHFAMEPTPPRIARALGIEDAAPALRTVRLRAYKGEPFSYAVTWLPHDIGTTMTAQDMENTPLLQLLSDRGAAPADAHQRVFATAATETVAPLLDLPLGAPLLAIERTVHDARGRTVEHIRAYYRPDRYEFELSMTMRSENGTQVWQPALAGSDH